MALFVKLASEALERQQTQREEKAPQDDTVVDTTWRVIE
jgi:hypothetical protein